MRHIFASLAGLCAFLSVEVDVVLLVATVVFFLAAIDCIVND